jgi:hypothetical protein
MSVLRRISVIAGAAALAVPLAACGGGSDFCDELNDFAAEYTGMQNALLEDSELMVGMIGDMRKVAESAPDDVRSDWNSYIDAFESVMSVADDAASNDDAEADDDAADAVTDAATAIAELESAGQRINEHAQQECEIQIG